MNVLFVCNRSQHRSRTAAKLFQSRFNTQFAGIDSSSPVSKHVMDWANAVVLMDDRHRGDLMRLFPQHYPRMKIVSLGIPDAYGYNDPELVQLLKDRMKEKFGYL